MTFAPTFDDYSELLHKIDSTKDPRKAQFQGIECVTSARGRYALSAPTGSGKSLLALIGAAYNARAGRRTAIATYSNLLRGQYQEELDAVALQFPDLKFYSIMGAANYLCGNKLNQTVSAMSVSDSRAVVSQSVRNHRYAWETLDAKNLFGLVQPLEALLTLVQTTIDPEVTLSVLRSAVGADTDECSDCRAALREDCDCEDAWERDENGKSRWFLSKCDCQSKCGYLNAKRLALRAHVVVTNQAMLSINAKYKGAVIGKFHHLVIDEVHKLEEALREEKIITAAGIRRTKNFLSGEDQEVADQLADYVETLRSDAITHWNRKNDESQEGWCVSVSVDKIKPLAERLYTSLSDEAQTLPAKEANKAKRAADLISNLYLWSLVAEKPNGPREMVGTLTRRKAGKGEYNRLKLTRVDLSEIAERLLLSAPSVTVMSATLGTLNRPLFALEALGIDATGEGWELVVLPAAFDYNRQMVFRVKPNEDLANSVQLCEGSALILTTAYTKIYGYSNYLIPLKKFGINVYKQERESARKSVLTSFVKDVPSVLVATASFFEGVNVRGDSLRHVVIPDLAKVWTGVPLQQQIALNMRAEGRDYKKEYELPWFEMVLEQQAGRLIRSNECAGYVTVSDRQAASGPYRVSIWNVAKKFGSRVEQ